MSGGGGGGGGEGRGEHGCTWHEYHRSGLLQLPPQDCLVVTLKRFMYRPLVEQALTGSHPRAG